LKKGEDGSGMTQFKGVVQPIDYTSGPIEMQAVTDELKSIKAFTTMRLAKQETKVAGYRMSVKNRKDKK